MSSYLILECAYAEHFSDKITITHNILDSVEDTLVISLFIFFLVNMQTSKSEAQATASSEGFLSTRWVCLFIYIFSLLILLKKKKKKKKKMSKFFKNLQFFKIVFFILIIIGPIQDKQSEKYSRSIFYWKHSLI